MIYCLHTLSSTVSEEIDRLLVEIFLVGLGSHDVSANLSHWLQGTIPKTCVNLHTAGIEHRTEQRLRLLSCQFPKQDRHAHQFESRY